MHQGVRGVAVAIALIGSVADAVADPEATQPPEPTSTPAPVVTPAPEPAVEPAPATGVRWQPFGYLRLQYIMVQNDPNLQFVGRDDGFELQNARLGVRGELNARTSFVVAIDGAVDERALVNTPQGKLRVGLRDAFVDLGLAGRISTRAGYFATLIDPDALEDATHQQFVDRAIEIRGMRATEGYQTPGLPPGRSLGAALRLDPAPTTGAPTLGFELAIQNGADEYASNNDNDLPAVSVAAIARLPHAGWLVAGARYNPRTVGDLPFRQDENDLQGTVGLSVVAGPILVGGGVFVQNTSYATTGGPSSNGFGGHGQLLFRADGALPLTVGYRFGILDLSSLLPNDRVMEHTVGATLGVPAYRMRVQLQATHVIEQASRDLSNDRIQLAAEVTL